MPWISVSTRHLSSLVIKPIATPATGRLIGTPASISERLEPQTEAIDDDPFDESVSETSRIVYGNSSLVGSTARSERSASAPWPISRRRAGRALASGGAAHQG